MPRFLIIDAYWVNAPDGDHAMFAESIKGSGAKVSIKERSVREAGGAKLRACLRPFNICEAADYYEREIEGNV